MTITKTETPRRGRLFRQQDVEHSLPDGALACRWCGEAVSILDRSQIETLRLYGQPVGRDRVASVTELAVTRCGDCLDRRAGAERILNEHPKVRRENGNVGVDRLDAALAAFDAFGDRKARLASSLLENDRDLRELMEVMAPFGGAVAWSATSAHPGRCEARRWGHVPKSVALGARAAFVALIKRRAEPVLRYAPPSSDYGLRGCGLCGVATLATTESKAVEMWGPEFKLHPGTLGGANRPEPVLGHLCPTDRAAVAAVGPAVGMPAVWHAIILFRGYQPITAWAITSMSGVRAFAALRPGTEPNAKPWAHVDLDALDRELAVSPYVRKRTVAA